MREVKFRAWEPDKKKMYYQDFSIRCDGRIDRTWGIYSANLEFMQFTGLKDKNGKEIYEGDIVQVYSLGWQDSENEDSEYGLFNKYRIDVVELGRPHLWLRNETHGYEGEDLVEPEEVEIIGNIYENPELAPAGERP